VIFVDEPRTYGAVPGIGEQPRKKSARKAS